jgi:hypothetical protein
LREYEQKELQATVFMQLAAKKVAWENAQLRNLLASKGVSGQDIEEFLRSRDRSRNLTDLVPTSPDAAARGWLQSSAVGDPLVQTSHINDPTSRVPLEIRQHSNMPPDMNQAIVDTPLDSVRDQVAPQVPPAHSSMPEDSSTLRDKASSENHWDWDSPSTSVEEEQLNMLPVVSDCFCPVNSTKSLLGRDNLMLEMSCETAASIIAGMRRNGDKDNARSELGCEGDRQCNVKNIKVLQAMGIE